MAQAAVGAAALNVKVNANDLQDKVQADILREQIGDLETRVAEVARMAQETAAERGGY